MTDDPIQVGSITITYEIDSEGDMITGVHVDGDLPIVTQLGLLKLAEDTVLNTEEYDDD